MSRRLFEIAFALQGRLDSSFRGAFRNADSQMNRLTRGISDTRNSLRQLDSQYRQGGMSLTQYIAQQERLNGVLRRQQRELQAQERHQQRVNRAQAFEGRVNSVKDNARGNMMDAVAKAGMVAAPIKQAIEFEGSFSDIKKVVDFDTDGEIAAMKKEIIDMTKEIPMSGIEFNEIIASGGQANIAKNELTTFARSAAKMGVAFGISAEESGSIMAEWRSAFKMNQTEVEELADKVNYLGNKSAAAAPDISNVLQRIGPLGEVAGATSGDVAALGAAMVEVGIAPEIAATGIKNMFLNLTAGDKATKGQKSAFKRLGFEAKEFSKAMQDDAQGSILKIFEGIQKLEQHEQAAVLTEFFGKDSVAAIAPLLTDLDRLKELFTMVGDESQYAGSMQAEFDAKLETTEAKLQIAKNKVLAVSETLGNKLLPVVGELAEKFGAGAEKVQAFAEKHPKLTKAIALGTAGMLAMSVAATAIGYAGALMLSPFAKLITLITKLGRAPGILGRIASSMRGIRPPEDCGAGGGNRRGRRGRRGGNRGGDNSRRDRGRGGRRNDNDGQRRRRTRPPRPPRPPRGGGLGGLVRRGASGALNGIRNMGVSGLLKGGAKLGMRAIPMLGAGKLAFDVGKFAYNKMGGLDGIKSKIMPKAEAAGPIGPPPPPPKPAAVDATAAGQATGKSFSDGLASSVTSNAISAKIFDQFQNVANGARAFGDATGFNFGAGMTQSMATNTVSSGMFDQFQNVALGARSFGDATGFNFGAGITQSMATNTVSSTIFDQFQNIALGATSFGQATGFNFATGLTGTSIDVVGWLTTNLYVPLNGAATTAYGQGVFIATSIARGLAAGKAAIAAQVQEISALAAQAASINVNVKASGKAGGGGRVPKYARGTIATSPHMGIFGEAGPEALIPLDGGSTRSHALYRQAGAALGYKNEAQAPEAKMHTSSSSITLHYAPVIQGNKAEVETILREDKSSFIDQLKELQAQQRRVTFG